MLPACPIPASGVSWVGFWEADVGDWFGFPSRRVLFSPPDDQFSQVAGVGSDPEEPAGTPGVQPWQANEVKTRTPGHAPVMSGKS